MRNYIAIIRTISLPLYCYFVMSYYSAYQQCHKQFSLKSNNDSTIAAKC